MARRTWKDRVVEFPRRFKDQNNNILELTPMPGAILEAGTPVNAANLNGLEDDLATHMADKANPHGVTKTQVGLGNVPNYSVSTQAQAQAGADNASIMTPIRVKDAIDNLSAVKRLAVGTYTGDGVEGRILNIGFTPIFLEIWKEPISPIVYDVYDNGAIRHYSSSHASHPLVVIVPNGVKFEGSFAPNTSGEVYKWRALG